MPDIRIPFPTGGLNDNQAFGDQPALTTRESGNMRVQDPVTGRMRGAQRSGTERYIDPDATIDGTNPVRAMASVTFGKKNVKYEALTDAQIAVLKSVFLPGDEPCNALETDSQGNVWALDHFQRLVKFNSELVELASVSLPLASGAEAVFGLDVDEFDRVYVSVGTGMNGATVLGNQAEAAIWCFEQDAEGTIQQRWEIKPGAFTRDLRVKDGKLYTVQNRHDRYKTDVVVYGAIDSTSPVEVLRIEGHPYPGDCIAVKDDGAILAGSEAFADRGTDPKSPDSGAVTVGWTPDDWADKDVGLWARFSAKSILGKELGNTGLVEDGPVPFLADLSGKARHLYQDTQNGHKAPTFVKDAWAGLPAVRFNGIDQVLASLPSLGPDPETKDSSKTLLPCHEGSAFCIFMVVRLHEDDETGNTGKGVILAQRNQGPALAQRYTHAIWANRAPGTAIPGTTAAGILSISDNPANVANTWEDGGDASGQPFQAEFNQLTDQTTNNPHRVVLLTYLNDGGLELSGANPASQTATRSLLRMNGNPIDRWSSRANAAKAGQRGYLGWGPITPIGTLVEYKKSYGKFDLMELIVLVNKTGTGEPKILTHPFYGQNPGTDDAADVDPPGNTDMEKFEGYLAHAWGIAAHLPQGDVPGGAAAAPAPPALKHEYEHSYADDAPLDSGMADVNELNVPYALLVKYSSGGSFLWVVNAEDGVGSGVAVASDGSIFTMGPADKPAGDNNVVRKIKDNGATFATSGAGTWATETALVPTNGPLRIAVDEFDNAYFPFYDLSALHEASVVIYALDGTKLAQFEDAAAAAGTSCFAVAIPPAAPTYKTGEDFTSPSTYPRAEFCFIGNEQQTHVPIVQVDGIRKLSLVSVTSLGGTNRGVVDLAVGGGHIKKFTAAGFTVPSGGTAALDSTSQFFSAVSFKGRVYFADGKTYKQYDPQEDEVIAWESQSAGEIPARGKLLFVYRGRLCLARFADDPQNWAMSATDDPDNWDFFPPDIVPTQAVAGNLARAGLVPDVITSVIPWSDDVLIFGCDHEVWVLRGDPMAGGEFDQVTKQTGMAFGPSWAMDPDGVIYFMGTQTGLWRMPPGGAPVRISEHSIERRFQDVDLGTHYFHLGWNHKDEGLHIYTVPYGAPGETLRHWFWEKKVGAFWEDDRATTLHQPICLLTKDGDDPEDRVLLEGCGDGRIRRWSATATDDDDAAIDSHVLIGPIASSDIFNETKFNRLQIVLASDQGGATAELYTSHVPDVLGNVEHVIELAPGLSPSLPASMRGSYCWLRLRNASPGQRWAFESAVYGVSPGGRKRVGAK